MAETYDLHQVPPGAEIWDVAGTHYLVWYNTELDPPVPMAWMVPSSEERKALGIDPDDVTRTFASFADANRTGWTRWGSSRELANTDVDPREQVMSRFESEARVKPWLLDPEMMTLWFMAAYEGRAVSQAEIQGTDWWRTHTEAERSWLSLNASDPSTANRMIADNRAAVADLMRQAGISNAPDDLVQLIADNWTTGVWSQTYATNQVRYLADPFLASNLDPTLRRHRQGLDVTRNQEDTVRNLVQEWLGPAMGQRYSQQSIARWASRLREDPDARLELEETLRGQRLALFPEYENPNLTYEDIAGPWRGVWQDIMGGVPDETHADFTKVIRMNDLTAAQSYLLDRGLETGNDNVVNRTLGTLARAFDPVSKDMV